MIEHGLLIVTRRHVSNCSCTLTIYILSIVLALASYPLATADELPAVSDRLPVAVPHFPNALHAVRMAQLAAGRAEAIGFRAGHYRGQGNRVGHVDGTAARGESSARDARAGLHHA